MEIITSIKHDDKRHEVVNFLKNDVKPFIIHLIDPKKVKGYVDGKSVVQTIEEIITGRWTSMLTLPNQITGQMVTVELVDNAWVHVHVMINGKKERMVMLLSGQNKDLNFIDIGFVGNENTFNEYMKKLNISDLEVQMNIIHYNPNEYLL
ncbi:MAG: hypothetical protein PHG15_03720 [Acinetobacter sp.]|uniref:hypothetical protein n=1 Tax=Acinetobacter sp. TaxID=472 RepID=UPI00262A13A3|nr:hypothetical protein [Acinetobacter sp.]MDD2944920.1 hypothetical protein [Acinetobacter sp.]